MEVAGGASLHPVAADSHVKEECLAQCSCGLCVADEIVQVIGQRYTAILLNSDAEGLQPMRACIGRSANGECGRSLLRPDW